MGKAQLISWEKYFQNTKGKPPRPLLVEALAFVKNKDTALDFGSGALNESKFLLKEGFNHVFALDKTSVALSIAADLPKDKFEYIISTFEDFNFPNEYFDLINAQYALPFITPESFDFVFSKIDKFLKTGGIFTGQFFGDRDGWKDNKTMTFKSKIEAEKYLGNFKVLSFKEEEQDKSTAAGDEKHWHVFHFIAEKK